MEPDGFLCARLRHDVVVRRPEGPMSDYGFRLLLPEHTIDLDPTSEEELPFLHGHHVDKIAGSHPARPEEIARGMSKRFTFGVGILCPSVVGPVVREVSGPGRWRSILGHFTPRGRHPRTARHCIPPSVGA